MVVNTGNDGNFSVSDWFRSLPIITQYWLGATIVLTLAGNFGMIDVVMYAWSWDRVKDKFELWRALTSFCYAGGFSFPTLITIYMLYSMSLQYEKGPFNTGAGGGTADYLFSLMFAVAMMLVTFPLMRMMGLPLMPWFCRNLVFFTMYVWSKRNPTAQANIYGIPIPGVWLPFAYLAFSVFVGASYFDLIHGMIIGHIYYFLADVVPQVQGRAILVTPKFLIDTFGVGQYRPEAAPAANPAQNARPVPGQPAPAAGGAYNWGATGRRLGRD